MKIHIIAVGRLKSGPERDIIDDYTTRFERIGRAMNLGPVVIHEVEDKKNLGPKSEAELLTRTLPKDAFVIALDERGTLKTSPKFSQELLSIRDQGHRDLAFIIGGADGLDPSLRDRANGLLSFGKMVWPHMLVRVMLAEQLYRAASIAAGTPYHRE